MEEFMNTKRDRTERGSNEWKWDLPQKVIKCSEHHRKSIRMERGRKVRERRRHRDRRRKAEGNKTENKTRN